jgi:OmpA-OmpF porin, OOP family
MIRLALSLSLALALPAAAKAPLKLNFKMPNGVNFARGSHQVPPGQARNIDAVKAYLAQKKDVTLLRIQGFGDAGDRPAAAGPKGAARAMAVAAALVGKGVDCKRLIAVGFAKAGPKNLEVTFVNAALRGKPIGGMPVDGGGKVAGDVCSGKEVAQGHQDAAQD